METGGDSVGDGGKFTGNASERACDPPARCTGRIPKVDGWSFVFAEAIAGSLERASVNEGPHVSSQQGIGSLSASPAGGTQHAEHSAPSGAARKAAPIKARTGRRSRVIRSSKLAPQAPKFRTELDFPVFARIYSPPV